MNYKAKIMLLNQGDDLSDMLEFNDVKNALNGLSKQYAEAAVLFKKLAGLAAENPTIDVVVSGGESIVFSAPDNVLDGALADGIVSLYSGPKDEDESYYAPPEQDEYYDEEEEYFGDEDYEDEW